MLSATLGQKRINLSSIHQLWWTGVYWEVSYFHSRILLEQENAADDTNIFVSQKRDVILAVINWSEAYSKPSVAILHVRGVDYRLPALRIGR